MTRARPPHAQPEQLPRFDRVERYAHWCTATLMLILLFTGFSMYAGPLSTLVGRRLLVRTVHLYAGLLLPIPVLRRDRVAGRRPAARRPRPAQPVDA